MAGAPRPIWYHCAAMSRLPVPVFVVDAFTPVPFSGNPAGVVLLEPGQVAPEPWLQRVAAEMRHAETAYVRPRPADWTADEAHWDLRWFTPESEVDLCGHATLASAHTLFEMDPSMPSTVVFHTRSGLLPCRRNGHLIEMDFPSLPVEQCPPAEGLLASLGVSRPLYVGRSKFDFFVELKDEDAVRALKPDLPRLARLEPPFRGVVVCARGTMYDVVSRFFAPACGVPEDPVTGSAHCTLAPYYSPKLGKSQLTCYQASPRGGIVNTHLKDDRTVLSGDAVTVLRGNLTGWK